jgi:hypothetical protein
MEAKATATAIVTTAIEFQHNDGIALIIAEEE